MKKSLLIGVALVCSSFIITPNLMGQTILNGSFETNSAGSSSTNLSNANFNQLMSNVNAFGNYSQLDIYTGSTWATWGTPYSQDQNWRVGVGTEESTNKADAFALRLSAPLVQGNSYTISYYDIGRDSNPKSCLLEIGISTNSSAFGDLVYTSPYAQENSWTQRSFNFIAPNNGEYITVRSIVGSTSYGYQWTFIDNFELTSTVGIINSTLKAEMKIYPNPSTGKFTISFDQPLTEGSVFIIDITGKEVYAVQNVNNKALQIDINNFNKGVYFVKIQNNNYQKVIKLIKK